MLLILRRNFITLLSGAVVALPSATRAQQVDRVRLIGILLSANAKDPEYASLIDAFMQGLAETGWIAGHNLRVETRWAAGDIEGISKNAAELVAIGPEVIMTPGAAAAGPALRATHTIPIVFTIVPDPVGAGFVDSLARPGGNATGFASFEYGIAAKWVELLKTLAPNLTRVGVLRDPAITAGIGQFEAIQSVSRSAGVEARPINMRDENNIKRDIAAFAASGSGGLIITSSGMSVVHRDLIIALASQYKLPSVYYGDAFVTRGGLISYGSNRTDEFRRAAGYVDRILKGENPSDLPVQTPTKYDLVINLKTAKGLGITVPQSLLSTADNVIE
jgi:putative tryptophan/tyrosine transport system substrate-binding protein